MTYDKLYTSLSANTIMAKLTNHVQRTNFITSSTDKYYSLDSEDDFRSGCRKVSHQQQFFLELPSPERSNYTNYFLFLPEPTRPSHTRMTKVTVCCYGCNLCFLGTPKFASKNGKLLAIFQA